jgi:hypothetical protein
MKPETKFYAQVKRNFTEIQWTRLENLKNKQVFSPHACLKVPKLYEGSCIRELVANGLKLEPRTQGWINSEEFLSKLGA